MSGGYLFACEKDIIPPLQNHPEEVNAPYPQEVSKTSSYGDDKSVTIVFTVDDKNRIHVLHVEGGYNLLTQYIMDSLEGKELKSENAIPGINYIMKVKFNDSV